MTNNVTESDPDFCFPFSPSVPAPYHHRPHQNPNPRKKRTKMIKFESRLIPSTTSCSGATICSSSTTSGLPKPKYHVKKPDPSAPKITKPCSECGKRFWSWKALYGHMRCHPERQWRGINPPPNNRRPISPTQQFTGAEAVVTADDHDVAESLLLLANSAGVTILETERGDCVGVGVSIRSQVQEEEEEEAGNCRFECSSCKKVFGTHQALGGHRASHKNVKGCFAITRSDGCDVIEDHSVSGDVKEDVEDSGGNHKKVMVLGHHQCGICLRVFTSGQALGGHKRCHWEKGEEASSSMTMTMNQGLNAIAPKDSCGLDLNLPAPVEEESSSSYSSGLTLDLRLGL